jgi:uncharacterized cupredoxin-like copper-binding protein
MKAMKGSTLALGAVVALSSFAYAHDDHGHKHHAGDSYSAGEAGDPKKPARTIEVEMREMEYLPPKIEVKRGEQIRFVIHNTGTEAHEFLLATTTENLKHEAVMRKNPDMSMTSPMGCASPPSSQEKSCGSSPSPVHSNMPA